MKTTLAGGVTAADVLRKDHDVITDLFRRVEDAASDRRKKIIGDRCLREVEALAALEEKVFYPAVRRDLGEDQLVAQAMAENAAARRLIDELKELPAGERYNARFRELRENIVSHIDEEETALLLRVERSDMDIEQLGAQLLARKRRSAPRRFDAARLRKAAALAAGVAVAGGAFWLARRLGERERSSM